MGNYNTRDWLEYGMYRVPCCFSNVDGFLATLDPILTDEILEDGLEAAKEIRLVVERVLEPGPDAQIADPALGACIARDLAAIAKAVVGTSSTDVQRSLDIDLAEQKVRTEYGALGLSIPVAQVEVVDDFPGPYAGMPWNAMAPDVEDQIAYGIEPGIYLRRDRLRPVFSQCLVAHELVHLVPAASDPFRFPMGLEEGLADLLGNLFAAPRLIGKDAAARHFGYYRLGDPQPAMRSAYLVHTRQALALYETVGLTEVVMLLERGRTAIHEAEAALVRGEFCLRQGGPPLARDPELDWVAQVALQSSPTHQIVEPAHFLLLDAIRDERMSLGDLSTATAVDVEHLRGSLQNMSEQTKLLLLDDAGINLSNVEFYRDLAETAPIAPIRYSVPDSAVA